MHDNYIKYTSAFVRWGSGVLSVAYAVTKEKKPTDKPQNFNSLVLWDFYMYTLTAVLQQSMTTRTRLSLPYLILYFPFLIVHLEENDSVKCVFAGIKLRSIDINDVNVLVQWMAFLLRAFSFTSFLYIFLFSKFNAFIKGVRNYSLSSMRWSITVGGFMRDLIKFKLTLSLWRGTTYASPMKCIGLYAAKLQTRTLENVNI